MNGKSCEATQTHISFEVTKSSLLFYFFQGEQFYSTQLLKISQHKDFLYLHRKKTKIRGLFENLMLGTLFCLENKLWREGVCKLAL